MYFVTGLTKSHHPATHLVTPPDSRAQSVVSLVSGAQFLAPSNIRAKAAARPTRTLTTSSACPGSLPAGSSRITAKPQDKLNRNALNRIFKTSAKARRGGCLLKCTDNSVRTQVLLRIMVSSHLQNTLESL